MKHLILLTSLILLSSPVIASTCKVKDPDIQGYYSGECKNGFASGKGLAIGRDKYDGAFVAGEPHGWGVYSWGPSSDWSGDTYDGNWINGERTGYGIYSSERSLHNKDEKTNSLLIHEGIFKNGQLTHTCKGKDNCTPVESSKGSQIIGRPFNEINQDTYSEILSLLKGIPQEKGEFETTVEFNEKKKNYLKGISKRFDNAVFVYELSAAPSYNADKGELSIYHPFSKNHGTPNKYRIRWTPEFYENTGSQELKELGKIFMGKENIQTYIQHSFDVTVQINDAKKQFINQLSIPIPPNKAQTYKGKYRWRVGLILNPEGMTYDNYEHKSDDSFNELSKGYIKNEKYHDINGQLAFLNLFIEGTSVNIYEYYSPSHPKELVEMYY